MASAAIDDVIIKIMDGLYLHLLLSFFFTSKHKYVDIRFHIQIFI